MPETESIDDIVDMATSTKDDLIKSWKEKECFIDKDSMQKSGIMSEAIGLTCIMLLTNAFGGNESFWKTGDKETINDIVEKSIVKIDAYYEDDCFNAEPLVNKEDTKSIFNKDNGYTDTVTWVVSSLVIVRYNLRKGIIAIGDSVKKITNTLIAEGVKQIVSSQSERGMWGFMTTKPDNNALANEAGVVVDGKSVQESLYFTYAVNSTVADIFDYVFGEIYLVLGGEKADYRDVELIDYLNKEMGIKIEEKFLEIRRNTAKWLLTTALPNLRQISKCVSLGNIEDRMKLGIWSKQESPAVQTDYIYLYYTYYIIDMLTMSYSDSLFEEIAKAEDGNEVFDAFVKNRTVSEKRFLKDSDDLLEDLYKTTIESAIQLSKTLFIDASRTGTTFWTNKSGKSELKISWNHNLEDIDYEINTANPHDQRIITDPCLVPMALRSVADYCYYIPDSTDYTVDKLFRILKKNRSADNEDNRVKDLWDDQKYNLQVTERSIEAIIDYYDYRRRYDKEYSDKPQAVPTPILPKKPALSDADSALIKALDQKIAQATTVPDENKQPSQSSVDINILLDEIYSLMDEEEDLSGFEPDKPQAKMLKIFRKMFVYMLLSYCRESYGNDRYNSKTCAELLKENEPRWRDLVKTIVEDGKGSVKWCDRYTEIMRGPQQ